MTSRPRSWTLATLSTATLEIVFCIVLPLAALSWAFGNAITGGAVTDFEQAFYSAAETLWHGDSPYPSLDDPAVSSGVAYVYPPLTAILVVPLTALSPGVAGLVVMALLIAAVIGTLFVLGIRDWRCYGLVFAWPAVYSGIMAGTLSIPLALAAALVWRFRDRGRLAATSLGLGVALKLILWPLAIWLAATRRLATAMLSVGVAVVALGASWAVIGFAGIRAYPDLLNRVQKLEEADSYTIYALAGDLGASSAVARAMWLAVAAALLAGVVHLGRRGDDRRAFVLALAAALACTPIVWLHYFALLVVVVGVAEHRLGPAWFIPLAMYGSTATTNGSTLQTALTIGAAALTVVVAVRPAPSARDVSVPSPRPRRFSGDRPEQA